MSCVLGISDHYGCAVFVCVAVQGGEPVVVDRRPVELIEPGLPTAPYHHETLGMDSEDAEKLVRRVRESAQRCAERELTHLRARDIVAMALREGPLPRLPDSVAEVHASYAATNRADGMLYLDALCRAAPALGIAVETLARGEERRLAADALRTTEAGLEKWLAGQRARLGPPWHKDHRDAAARAIAVLGKRGFPGQIGLYPPRHTRP